MTTNIAFHSEKGPAYSNFFSTGGDEPRTEEHTKYVVMPAAQNVVEFREICEIAHRLFSNWKLVMYYKHEIQILM